MATCLLLAGIPTEGGSSPVFIAVVGTFMAIVFVFTLTMALRSWKRGWPEFKVSTRGERDRAKGAGGRSGRSGVEEPMAPRPDSPGE